MLANVCLIYLLAQKRLTWLSILTSMKWVLHVKGRNCSQVTTFSQSSADDLMCLFVAKHNVPLEGNDTSIHLFSL